MPWTNAGLNRNQPTPAENSGGANVGQPAQAKRNDDGQDADGKDLSYFAKKGVEITGFDEAIRAGRPVLVYVCWPRGGNFLSKEETENVAAKETYTFESQCLSNPKVQQCAAKFSCLKINASSVDREILKDIKVPGIPSVLLFGPDGKLVNKVANSRMSAKAMTELLIATLKKCGVNVADLLAQK